jgi:hypothetical protein
VVVIASVPHALCREAGCIRDVRPRKVVRGDVASATTLIALSMNTITNAGAVRVGKCIQMDGCGSESHALIGRNAHTRTMKLFLTLVFLAAACSQVAGTFAPTVHAASVKKSATPASSALTLRVRLTDGTVKRVQAAPGDSIEDVCSQVTVLQLWLISESCIMPNSGTCHCCMCMQCCICTKTEAHRLYSVLAQLECDYEHGIATDAELTSTVDLSATLKALKLAHGDWLYIKKDPSEKARDNTEIIKRLKKKRERELKVSLLIMHWHYHCAVAMRRIAPFVHAIMLNCYSIRAARSCPRFCFVVFSAGRRRD